MTLSLDLSRDLEARLEAAARQSGTDPSECALQVLTEHLPPRGATIGADPTIALLSQWRDEDATHDPDEIRAAEVELDELKSGLNANRAAAGARLLFP